MAQGNRPVLSSASGMTVFAVGLYFPLSNICLAFYLTVPPLCCVPLFGGFAARLFLPIVQMDQLQRHGRLPSE